MGCSNKGMYVYNYYYMPSSNEFNTKNKLYLILSIHFSFHIYKTMPLYERYAQYHL